METIIKKLTTDLLKLKRDSGLFVAANGPEYNLAWLRDLYYEYKPFLKLDKKIYKEGYEAIVSYILGLDCAHDRKLSLILEGCNNTPCMNELIHVRINADTGKEYSGDWCHNQWDAISYVILGICEGFENDIYIKNGAKVINILVDYLYSIEAWKTPDVGIWEEYEFLAVRASSVGAIIGATNKVLEFSETALKLNIEARKAFEKFKINNQIFEIVDDSKVRAADMALATLIYPFNLFKEGDKYYHSILCSLDRLLKANGLIRYEGDQYYHSHSGPMQWPIGLAFMAEINREFDPLYCCMLIEQLCLMFTDNESGIPEGYIDNGNGYTPNDNSNLGWSTAMLLNLLI